MKHISLLGATGSIGTQTLDVIRQHPSEFKLSSMSVGRNIDLALEQVHEFRPKLLSVQSKDDYDKIVHHVPTGTEVVYGEEGLIEVAQDPDASILVNAIIGSVGLIPTLTAIETGKTIAIANKETLVTAGHIVTEAAKKHGVTLIPVDSEHSAIFQALNGEDKKEILKLILTASGGSFRDKSRDELKRVTVHEALNHPNWSMGAKITIDSATMMNKGLEVIEAHWLFGVPYEKIDVVLHKESIVHSMVEYIDHSIIAQLGVPDMRIPIQYALTYPNRLQARSSERLNLAEIGKLHFAAVDFSRYRCLAFAYEAGKVGGTLPTVLNAANEVAVKLFLEERISFLEIETLIERALEHHDVISDPSLDDIIAVDKETRRFVHSIIS